MFLGNLVKKNSKLGYSNGKDKLLYNLFMDKIKEGEEVEIFICKKGKKGSPAQIAKIHASIRELAGELGFTFEDMKLVVKEKAGLCYNVADEDTEKTLCKSFSDCSILELTLAIEACKDIAEKNNIILQ